MSHFKPWRALAACAVMLATAPAVEAAAPVAAPSPSPAQNCTIPPGTEGDPQEQALLATCKAEQTKIQTEKGKLTDNLALAQGSSDSLQQMLKQTHDAITANQTQQAQTRAEIQRLEVHEAQTIRDIGATRKRLDLRRADYASYLRRSYKFQPDLVAEIIESKGISDFLSRTSALIQVRTYGSHLLRSIKIEEKRLQDESDQLHHDRELAIQKQNDLVNAQNQLISDEVKEALILTALNGSIKDAKTELASADTQTAALVAQIVAAQIARQDQLIQAANDAAWAAAQAWMASNKVIYPASTGHANRFIWPTTKGIITLWFGPSDYAAEPAGPPGSGVAHYHYGIDVAADSGTPILAADDGVVVAAEDSMLNGHLIGYGRHLIVAHQVPAGTAGGTPTTMLTLYGHLEGYFVKVGDKVFQGQTIGLMGSTGNSSGPHVHFELRVDNKAIDPRSWLPPPGQFGIRG